VRVLVFDVPATESGALTGLLDFYRFVVAKGREDIEWIFVVSTDALGTPPEGSRIRIVRRPETKRNWIRRILFEIFVAPGLIRQYQADAILSLQNTAILWTRVPQIVYVQNALPYAPMRFSYASRDERLLAAMGDIFRPLIGWSVRKSRTTVVQTNWLKNAIERKHGIAPGKIAVVPQTVDLHAPPGRPARIPGHFVYPAVPFVYKGHKEIVDAVAILHAKGHRPQVVFTIEGTENPYSRALAKRIKDLGLESCFDLVGHISRDRLVEIYRESVLLFVSRLESFGLPLAEARILGIPVIATRQPFSEEILDGYDQATLVGQGVARELAAAMKPYCNANPCAQASADSAEQPVSYPTSGGWDSVVDLLMKTVGE
jgi:glycosyltransferase involved in cell wall biosynthesis